MAAFILSTDFLITYILLISLGAGVLGTGVGGALGLLFKKSGNKAISSVLNFASGVMLAVVCFDLIPEAEALTGNKIYITAITIALSAAAIFGLSMLVKRIKNVLRIIALILPKQEKPILQERVLLWRLHFRFTIFPRVWQ
jgi:fructose-specific component phosphotransferase system IIB-like protein